MLIASFTETAPRRGATRVHRRRDYTCDRRGGSRAAIRALSKAAACLLLACVTPFAAQADTGAILTATDEADAMYADREQLPSALAAAAHWERRMTADAADFEAAWKLARACYWLGSHVPEADRRRRFEQGIEAGARAAALRPDRPDGHFWMAASMGAMAEGFGLRAGLRYRGPIKRALETALAIDPAYLHGGPDRALGRWYSRVPRLFGGSDIKAVEHLKRSLSYGRDSIASRFFLAETLLEIGRRDEAGRELEALVALPFDPDWVPEEREFKQRARSLLEELTRHR